MDKQKEIEEMQQAIRKGFETADCRNEYTKVPYPYFDSQILSIANCLLEAGYRKIIPNVDFVVRCSDLVNVREKAYDDARKATAKEILEYLRAVQEKDELKNCDLDWIAMQYGVEVDE